MFVIHINPIRVLHQGGGTITCHLYSKRDTWSDCSTDKTAIGWKIAVIYDISSANVVENGSASTRLTLDITAEITLPHTDSMKK